MDEGRPRNEEEQERIEWDEGRPGRGKEQTKGWDGMRAQRDEVASHHHLMRPSASASRSTTHADCKLGRPPQLH